MTDRHKYSSNVFTYQTEMLRTCVEVGKLLTSTLNLKEILELIMLKVSQLIRAKRAARYTAPSLSVMRAGLYF